MNTVKNFTIIHFRLNEIDKVCFPIKAEDLNLSAGINESKTLTKYIACECKYKFDENKCNSDQ